MAYHPTRKH